MMTTNLPEPQRQRLLEHAVDAVNAWLEYDIPDADPRVRSQRFDAASEAVTKAVKENHIYTLIAARTRCSGLRIAQLIADGDAYEEALVRERHAAELYAASVRHAIRTRAVGRVLRAQGDRGVKTETAERLRVSRPTLDKWLEEYEEGTSPATSWEDIHSGVA